MTNIDFVATMEPVARALLGEPNRKLSTRDVLRFGRNGSLKIDLQKGVWADYEAGEGGGVLALVKRELRCGTRDALAYLGAEPCKRDAPRRPSPKPEVSNERDDRARIRTAMHIWRCSEDPRQTPVEAYLASRDCILPQDEPERVLRYHMAAPWETGRSPAMVALMRNPVTCEPCGVHITALDQNARKIGRKFRGVVGAIMLSDSADVTTGLGITEGIENGLSVMRDEFRPVWALGSAGGISTFPVLGGIEYLSIWADHDDAGLDAARTCARRWSGAGREVSIRYPDPRGADWNDMIGGAE